MHNKIISAQTTAKTLQQAEANTKKVTNSRVLKTLKYQAGMVLPKYVIGEQFIVTN